MTHRIGGEENDAHHSAKDPHFLDGLDDDDRGPKQKNQVRQGEIEYVDIRHGTHVSGKQNLITLTTKKYKTRKMQLTTLYSSCIHRMSSPLVQFYSNTIMQWTSMT